MAAPKKPAATAAAPKKPAATAAAPKKPAATKPAASTAATANQVATAADDRAAAQMAELHLSTTSAGEATSAAATAPKAPKDLPKRAKLHAPYAYYDDEGQFRTWPAGHETEDAAEIRDLYKRGAPIGPAPVVEE